MLAHLAPSRTASAVVVAFTARRVAIVRRWQHTLGRAAPRRQAAEVAIARRPCRTPD